MSYATPGTISKSITLTGGGINLRTNSPMTLSNVSLPGSGSLLFNYDDQPIYAFTISNDATLSGTLAIEVGGGNGTAGAVTLSGALGGTGGITKTGTPGLILTGANTYTGTTTVSTGTLTVSGGGSIASSAIASIDSGAVLDVSGITSSTASVGGLSGAGTVANGSKVLRSVVASGTSQFGGTISGDGGLVKDGAGTLALTGTNALAGGITIAGGTLQLAAAGLLASGSYGVAIANGGAFDFASSANQTLAGAITGVGSLAKSGAGRLTLTASNGYTGNTTISTGTLALSGAGRIAASASVNVGAGAAFDVSASSGAVSVGILSGSGSVILGGNSLESVVPSGAHTFAGTISGSSGFTKAGAGNLTLSAIQSFTGRAAVEQGALVITQADRLQSAGSIFVADGATLVGTSGLTVSGSQTLGGYGTVDANVTFSANSILSPGGSVGQLDTTGNVTFTAPMAYTFELNDGNGVAGGPNGWDLYTAAGTMSFIGFDATNKFTVDLVSLSGTDAGTAADFDANASYAWPFLVAGTGNTINYSPSWFVVATSNFQNLSTNPERFSVVRGDELGAGFTPGAPNELYVVYAAVPEPGTIVLAGMGLAGLACAAAQRRRRRSDCGA